MKFRVLAYWTVAGEFEVDAISEEAAMEAVDLLPLPEGTYVDGSFDVVEATAIQGPDVLGESEDEFHFHLGGGHAS